MTASRVESAPGLRRAGGPGQRNSIVLVSPSGDPTGGPIVLTRLFRWLLTRAGKDAYLVFRYQGPLAEACRAEFPPGRVFVVPKKNPRLISGPGKPFSKVQDFYHLWRILRPLQPGVIIANSLINTLTVLLGRRLGAQVVLWVHEVPGSTNNPLNLRNRINRRAHLGLGVSHQSCDYLRAVGFPPDRIFKVPHGLDLEEWPGPAGGRTEQPDSRDRLILGALAVWSPNKRLDLVVAAAVGVAEKEPRRAVELQVGGPGDLDTPRLPQKILEDRPRLPANLTIRLLGPITDVRGFYRGLDALLLASEKESLPTVALEALAFQLPVFSFDDLPGVREIVGVDTFLARERTAEALAAKIMTFFFASPQPAALAAWRQYARERVREFSLEKQWAAMVRIIEGGVGTAMEAR